MERALRVISIERGHDPQSFTLISFGGAGGLHAVDLARRLSIPRVLVPPQAAVFSALGMLLSEVVKEHAQTVMLPGDTPLEALERAIAPLEERTRAEALAEGVNPAELTVLRLLDVRYQGQSYELTIPLGKDWRSTFHQAHAQNYGYAQKTAPLEIVNLRSRIFAGLPTPRLNPRPIGPPDPHPAFIENRTVCLASGPTEVPLYQGERLTPGNQIIGPALVLRPDTTILIGPTDQASVDTYHNLIIQIGKP
jgi:N-methylhydantoinase A